MPCAAPCNRLPCDERCSKTLGCGHRCPGLCGEPCPEKYCQECSSTANERVDLLEFKSYKEIDLDETPIVVLGCGHFFTAESLDGLMSLGDVYSGNQEGRFIGLLEPSALLPVPCCPDCKRPIRQFATQRYNRIINAAVLDEMSKRFLLKGQSDLTALEQRIAAAEDVLHETRMDTPSEQRRTPFFTLRKDTLENWMSERYKQLNQLERQATKFCQAMSIEQQPSKKLFDAIREAKNREPLDSRLAHLALENSPKPAVEKRVILGGRLARLRIRDTILAGQFRLHSKTKEDGALQVNIPHGNKGIKALLKDSKAFVKERSADRLPRLAIPSSLIYTRMAKCFQSFSRGQYENVQATTHYITTARKLLERAENMCNSPFSGAEKLRKEVDRAQRLLSVTGEELAAIKIAMVGGDGGIVAQTVHWYNCEEGHPVSIPSSMPEEHSTRDVLIISTQFAIGECGMPMEEARCNECGARIGGSNHRLAPGVSRAEEME